MSKPETLRLWWQQSRAEVAAILQELDEDGLLPAADATADPYMILLRFHYTKEGTTVESTVSSDSILGRWFTRHNEHGIDTLSIGIEIDNVDGPFEDYLLPKQTRDMYWPDIQLPE